MSFRSSNSLAVLAVALGCFALSPLSRAGDKIQFSNPSSPLEVPASRAEPALGKTGPSEPIRPDDGIRQEEMEDTPVVVVYAPVKKKMDHSWDSLKPDNSDNPDNSTDGEQPKDENYLDPAAKPVAAGTNSWDADAKWNTERRGAFTPDNPQAGQESLRGRLEAVNSLNKMTYQRDDRFEKDSSYSAKESALSASLFHYGLTGKWVTGEDSYHQFLDEMNMMNPPPGQEPSAHSSPFGSEERSRDYSFSSGASGSTQLMDMQRNTGTEDSFTAPRPYQAPPPKAVGVNTDPVSTMEPPASPAGQVQSRPGVLPFPKRPGSVFQ